MKDIVIENLRDKQDLNLIAKQYANYYNNSVLGETWTEEKVLEMFNYFYKNQKDLFFVAYINNRPGGVVMTLLKPWCDGMHLEDGEIFVCEEYRKHGVAKKLFKKLFSVALEKYDVSAFEAHTYADENGFPYCWYQKLGFETIDDWKIISGDVKEVIKKL